MGNNDPPPEFTSTPVFVLGPNVNAPLAGLLSFTTDVPTGVRLTVTDDEKSWNIDFSDLNTEHNLTVLGFRPSKTHTIEISVFDQFDNSTDADSSIEVTTQPLPSNFPEFSVVSDPERMEPGITIFPAGDFLIAIDGSGEVVWFYRITFQGGLDRDLRRLANGNLLLLMTKFKLYEIDMLGAVVRTWHACLDVECEVNAIPVLTSAFHHEIFEMDNGNFLTLSLELKRIRNFPSSDSESLAPRETALVGGDVVVEFAPNGAIVNEWPLLDMLDPLRIGYGSVFDQNGLAQLFPDVDDPIRDWAHANAVIHDTRDNSIIVSARNQDATFKFSRTTGELIWILGPHENWNRVRFGEFLLNPLNDMEFFWPYHQHAPMIMPNGNILLYDNGNFRASPFDPILSGEENFSRAVEYSINENTMDVSLVWEYGQFIEERMFTPFIGDADYLPITGNVLITFGGITMPRLHAKIIEVTHTTPAEKVFELSLPRGLIYRSERLPSLYP